MKDVNLLCQITFDKIRFSKLTLKINIHNGNIWLKECTTGLFGVDCKQQCSGHCEDNAVCNHTTGQCDEGCAAGWRGSECNIGILKL